MRTKRLVSGTMLLCLLHLNINLNGAEVIKKQMVYKTINDIELSVDMFYLEQNEVEKVSPVIAFFHGGGWVYGSPQEFHGACERFARNGFITFSFQYRLSINDDGTYPHPEISPIESVKDARSAIRWLRNNADKLNIDPNKIIAGGQSAGGQLALSTALLDNINEETDNMNISPVPNALLLFSSCYNTMEAWIDNLLGDRRTRIWDISPYHNLKNNLPPILAFHGNADCMVFFYTVLFFNDRMKDLGNEFELITLEGRDHYLGEHADPKYARYFDEEILERTDRFLSEHGFVD